MLADILKMRFILFTLSLLCLTPLSSQCPFNKGDLVLFSSDKRLHIVDTIVDGKLYDNRFNKENYEETIYAFDCDKNITLYTPKVGDHLFLKNGDHTIISSIEGIKDGFFNTYSEVGDESYNHYRPTQFFEEIINVNPGGGLDILEVKEGEVWIWRTKDGQKMKGSALFTERFASYARFLTIDSKGYHKVHKVTKSNLLGKSEQYDQIDTLHLLSRSWVGRFHLASTLRKIRKGVEVPTKDLQFTLEFHHPDNLGRKFLQENIGKMFYSFKNGGLLPADRYSFLQSNLPMTPKRLEDRLDFDWELIDSNTILLSNKKEEIKLEITSLTRQHLSLIIRAHNLLSVEHDESR